MPGIAKTLIFLLLCAFIAQAEAETKQRVIDIPTRPSVAQRIMLLEPMEPKAVVVMFPGGHGGMLIAPNGTFVMGRSNFLVRTRTQFAEQGLVVAIVDTPSDHLTPPFLQGFRETPQHLADIKIVVAWLRANYNLPVWLVGTSRGTLSVAYVATALSGNDAPDGIVLTSSVLSDTKERPVLSMPLEQIRVPVLVVHHEEDRCKLCAFTEIPHLMAKLSHSPRKQLIAVQGGESAGDPCEAFAHHGFNRIEPEVVKQIADWILLK